MRALRPFLAGVVILVLVHGLGSVAVAQGASPAPGASVIATELPTGPAAFQVTVKKAADGTYSFAASDPRFSGAFTFSAGTWLDVPTGTKVMADWKRVENDAGAWQGLSTGYIWNDGAKKNQQTWWVGEGAYAGLSAVTVNSDTEGIHGVIFEGVAPLWDYCQPLPAQ